MAENSGFNLEEYAAPKPTGFFGQRFGEDVTTGDINKPWEMAGPAEHSVDVARASQYMNPISSWVTKRMRERGESEKFGTIINPEFDEIIATGLRNKYEPLKKSNASNADIIREFVYGWGGWKGTGVIDPKTNEYDQEKTMALRVQKLLKSYAGKRLSEIGMRPEDYTDIKSGGKFQSGFSKSLPGKAFNLGKNLVETLFLDTAGGVAGLIDYGADVVGMSGMRNLRERIQGLNSEYERNKSAGLKDTDDKQKEIIAQAKATQSEIENLAAAYNTQLMPHGWGAAAGNVALMAAGGAFGKVAKAVPLLSKVPVLGTVLTEGWTAYRPGLFKWATTSANPVAKLLANGARKNGLSWLGTTTMGANFAGRALEHGANMAFFKFTEEAVTNAMQGYDAKEAAERTAEGTVGGFIGGAMVSPVIAPWWHHRTGAGHNKVMDFRGFDFPLMGKEGAERWVSKIPFGEFSTMVSENPATRVETTYVFDALNQQMKIDVSNIRGASLESAKPFLLKYGIDLKTDNPLTAAGKVADYYDSLLPKWSQTPLGKDFLENKIYKYLMLFPFQFNEAAAKVAGGLISDVRPGGEDVRPGGDMGGVPPGGGTGPTGGATGEGPQPGAGPLPKRPQGQWRASWMNNKEYLDSLNIDENVDTLDTATEKVLSDLNKVWPEWRGTDNPEVIIQMIKRRLRKMYPNLDKTPPTSSGGAPSGAAGSPFSPPPAPLGVDKVTFLNPAQDVNPRWGGASSMFNPMTPSTMKNLSGVAEDIVQRAYPILRGKGAADMDSIPPQEALNILKQAVEASLKTTGGVTEVFSHETGQVHSMEVDDIASQIWTRAIDSQRQKIATQELRTLGPAGVAKLKEDLKTTPQVGNWTMNPETGELTFMFDPNNNIDGKRMMNAAMQTAAAIPPAPTGGGGAGTPVPVTSNLKGHWLNIGLKIGEKERLSPATIKASINQMDDKAFNSMFLYSGPAMKKILKSADAEPTAVVNLNRQMTGEEMKSLLDQFGQKAIPQYSDGVGTMHGSQEWGDFNPDYFVLPGKKTLSMTAVESAEPTNKSPKPTRPKKKVSLKTKKGKKVVLDTNEAGDAAVVEPTDMDSLSDIIDAAAEAGVRLEVHVSPEGMYWKANGLNADLNAEAIKQQTKKIQTLLDEWWNND